MKKSVLLAVISLFFSGAAAVAEATEDGAARLKQVFQTYLGTSEGTVTVAVSGEDYVLTLDAAPLADLATKAGAGTTFSLTPQVLTLTDNGDGTWGVAQDQAVTMAFELPGAVKVEQRIGSLRQEGVFDAALMTFSSLHAEMTDLRQTQTQTDPTLGEMTTSTGIASASFDLTGVAGAAGGVDGTATQVMNGYIATFQTPASAGMPAMPLTVMVESLTQSSKIDGLRPEPLYKTLAWIVANPSAVAMAANKGQLKPILLSGIPIFSMLAGDMTAKNITATTPMGNVGIAEVGVRVGATGAVPEGMLREAITLSGLTLPPGMVPDWALPLLPQTMKIDVEVGNFNAEAGFTALLDLLDLPLGAEPDDALGDRIAAAFLPDNTISIGLNPGNLAGEGYELTFEGSMDLNIAMPIPTGKALVTLSGIEVLQAAIAEAPPEMQMNAMMGLGMAQGMAKPGANGELVWEIDATTPGSVMINGMPMMGGQ